MRNVWYVLDLNEYDCMKFVRFELKEYDWFVSYIVSFGLGFCII